MEIPAVRLQRPARNWAPTEMDDEELGLVVVYALFLTGEWKVELIERHTHEDVDTIFRFCPVALRAASKRGLPTHPTQDP